MWPEPPRIPPLFAVCVARRLRRHARRALRAHGEPLDARHAGASARPAALARAKRQRYLPNSQDSVLAPVLKALEADPSDNRTLPEFALAANTTERTLARRCERDLGMSLMEWRQRLRVVRALPLLEAGRK